MKAPIDLLSLLRDLPSNPGKPSSGKGITKKMEASFFATKNLVHSLKFPREAMPVVTRETTLIVARVPIPLAAREVTPHSHFSKDVISPSTQTSYSLKSFLE